jgi:LacI family transcriptional regulator
MKFESVTIKDIAKALNLSTSTVSRALRGSYEISPETKELVLNYAKKINYQPNPIALSLKERRSRSIGVVVSEIANTYFSQAINGIESIAYDRGYHVIISQTHESYDREVINVHHLASRGVDGLLVSISSGSQDVHHLEELHARGLPIVFFDRVPDPIDTHKVMANNKSGTSNVIEHLIDQGFRRIAHITNAPYLSITSERLEGYKEALEKHNIPFDEKLVKYCVSGGMDEEEVEGAVNELLSYKLRPDAFFTAGDRLTTVCLRKIKSVRKKEEAFGLAGFTNTNFAELFSPSLTCVRQPSFEMGEVATELLIELIESKRPVTTFKKPVLETQLIVRESSMRVR